MKKDTDLEYIKARLFWVVDKFKEEFYENGTRIETDFIFKGIFSLLRQGDWGLKDFDHLLLAIAYLMNYVVNRMHGKLKVTEDFFLLQFSNSVKLRTILQTSFVMHHLNFFVTTLVKAGIEISEIPTIITKSMEWAETNPYYDYTNDRYLNDLTHEMVRLRHGKGKPISQSRLSPPKKGE